MPVQSINANSAFSKMQLAPAQTTASKQTQKPNIPAHKPEENGKLKNTLVYGALALAVLGGAAYWQRSRLGLDKIGNAEKNLEKLTAKINGLKQKYKPDALKVLQENTVGDMVKLENIEPAAAIRSASPTEENKFHQAASWIEEAYKEAYSRAELKDDFNILDYIAKRIGMENNTLAQMYAQMPKEEAEIRIKQFAAEAQQKDFHTGMTVDEFVKKMWEAFIPKAKNDLLI